VDTSPETSGKNVQPQIHRNYDGGDIILPGDPSKVLRVADNPELARMKGGTIVTTDGTTLLGSDDKSGVAVIMEAAAYLLAHSEIKHGPIRICFTCDEEIGNFAHDATAKCYPFDVAGAKSILDADGWTVGSDGIRVKNGQRLSLRWSTTQNNGRRQQGQTIGQSNLKDIGIEITIKNYPADTWFGSTLPAGDFDIGEYASSNGYDPDNPLTWLCNESPDKDPNGANYGFYCNQSVDQALKTEEGTPDQATRLQAFKTFEQALLTDLPVVYLYNFGTLSISRSTVHNYGPSANGPSETWNVWQWWIG
jgi:hypothetical protein